MLNEENNSFLMDIVEGDSDLDRENNVHLDERAGAPTELIDASADAAGDSLPLKSNGRYEKVYDDYLKWKEIKKAASDSEIVVLAYFNEMVKSNKEPTTIWPQYSMLKATLKICSKVNIETYKTLTALLKIKSHGYIPKKARVFTEDEMQHFLDNAPDELWLDVKV